MREIIARTWGVTDDAHPYIKQLLAPGKTWSLGGEVERLVAARPARQQLPLRRQLELLLQRRLQRRHVRALARHAHALHAVLRAQPQQHVAAAQPRERRVDRGEA